MGNKVKPNCSVLFVCTGNTCRSPMAEGLFRAAVTEDLDVCVGSAGVAAMPGMAMSRETASLLKQCNAEFDGFESRQINDEVVKEVDFIIAMTESHADVIKAHFPEVVERLLLLTDFLPQNDELFGHDVPDPIGMGAAAYHEVAEVITMAIPGIIEKTTKLIKS